MTVAIYSYKMLLFWVLGRPLQPSLELPQYLRESGSVNLSWTANVTEGVDHNYTIFIHNVTSTSQEVLVETTSLHYMFDKCGEFDIRVFAVNGAGQSAPSNTARVSLPLLPDITPVSQSLKHRVWKENGSITLQISFEVSPKVCSLCSYHSCIITAFSQLTFVVTTQ